MGLLILLGLPNATSVQQEMDIVYQGFKTATYARGEALLTRKLMMRARETQAIRILQRQMGQEDNDEDEDPQEPRALTIGFDDLSIVVDGVDGDPLELRPFRKYFTKERIIKSWEKVGFVPFTRKCLSHRKVRHELGQDNGSEASKLQEIQDYYNELVSRAESEGLNAGVFDVSIPTATMSRRISDEDAQVQELLQSKGAFSASGLWNICSTRVGNANVVIRAQQAHLKVISEKSEQQHQARVDRRAKLLASAQAALVKHENFGALMTDKDWVDIIRWVLPEAKMEGRLTDLKKKAVIMEKLATLDCDWRTYIPPITAI